MSDYQRRVLSEGVLKRVQAERSSQRKKWSSEHDQAHKPWEWLGLITIYAAAGQYVKAAAICVAAQECEELFLHKELVASPDGNITIRVIITGQPIDVSVNPHDLLHTIILKALEQTGNIGQPPDRWEIRDADGTLLSFFQRIEEFKFKPEDLLFLNLRTVVAR